MRRRTVLRSIAGVSVLPTLYDSNTMTSNNNSSNSTGTDRSTDDSTPLSVSLSFNGDMRITTTYEHEPVLTVTNPTDEYVTAPLRLQEEFGRTIFSADVTIPPQETKEYTPLWYVDEAYRVNKILHVTIGEKTETHEIETHPPIRTDVPFNLPDEVRVGEEITIPVTLENTGSQDGRAQLVVTHHIAGPDTPDEETVIYGEQHYINGSRNESNTKDITVTFTPQQPGNHVFTFDGELSETSTSIKVTE